jgi:acyl carrier protein
MRQLALEIVQSCLSELNEELCYESLRAVEDGTPVFGTIEGIDSLSLVTLVVDLEDAVESAFGRRVVLADDKAMSMRSSPYRTSGSLADFIVARLGAGDE